MKNNLDKWNEIELLIKNKSDIFIDNYFKDKNKPTTIYHLVSYNSIDELEIIDWSIDCRSNRKPYLYGRKPTKKNIEELKIYNDNFSPIEKDIYAIYRYGKSGSGGYSLKDILYNNERLSLTRDTLLPLQQILKEKYEPREGYIPCTYCGLQVPIKDSVEYTVIARQYTNMRKTSKYCSIQCGASDQMAHEG